MNDDRFNKRAPVRKEDIRIAVYRILSGEGLPVRKIDSSALDNYNQLKILYMADTYGRRIVGSMVDDGLLLQDNDTVRFSDYGSMLFGKDGKMDVSYPADQTKKLQGKVKDLYGQDKIRAVLSKQPGLCASELTEIYDCNQQHLNRLRKTSSLIRVGNGSTFLNFLSEREFLSQVTQRTVE